MKKKDIEKKIRIIDNRISARKEKIKTFHHLVNWIILLIIGGVATFLLDEEIRVKFPGLLITLLISALVSFSINITITAKQVGKLMDDYGAREGLLKKL